MIPLPSIPKDVDYEDVSKGLDFILKHLQEQTEKLFPRKIMTFNLGYQKEVYSKEDAIQSFTDSGYIDCRIRAFPDQSTLAKYFGYSEIAPNLIMIDLDKSHFSSNRALDTTLRMIRNKVSNEINGTPTILWTGNGYHIIQPIDATVLENIVELKIYEKPSEQFLRFAEWYLSNGKADKNHFNTLAFGNCLLRIPWSHNSKLVINNYNSTDHSTQVKIIQEWNGYRPHIRLLLGTFHAYLVEQRIKKLNNGAQQSIARRCSRTNNKIPWIESLIQTPISDSRRYCVWRILVPYLVNVRKLSDEEASSAILGWLERCNLLKRLSFDPRYITNYNIRKSRRFRYYPVSWNTLKIENLYIYQSLTVRDCHTI